jgi:hypothetical protein
MRYFITAISINLVTISQLLFAQAPDTMWTKTFGDSNLVYWGNFIQQTADSGFIAVGTISTISGEEIFLMRFDSNGDSLWYKRFDGGNFAYGSSVKQTSDGGFIITGSKRYLPLPGEMDIWLIKTDDIGDTLWTKTFGDNPSWERGYDVQQTTDDGYIIIGGSGDNGNSNYKAFLVKTDSNGDTLWTKTYGHCGLGASVQQTNDGGYIIATNGPRLLKTDVNGDTLWTKPYGGNAVQQTTDGGYIITGLKGLDAWLIKTNGYGDTLWTKTFGDSLRDIAYSVQQTTDGGYIIAGSGSGPWLGDPTYLFVAKFDVSGDILWTKIFWDNENIYLGYSIKQTFDNGYIIGGTSIIDYGNYYKRNIWLIKLAPDITSIIKTPPIKVKTYILYQNYPNPFNPSTTIKFDLPKTSEVSLKVFNILGEEVATLVSDRLSAGSYSYEWDASRLASGVYLYRLQAGNYVETREMVLMR